MRIKDYFAGAGKLAKVGRAIKKKIGLFAPWRDAAEVEEIQEIRETDYENPICFKLRKVKELAEAGEAGLMEAHLDIVRRCAERVGKDISPEVEEIQEIGYNKGIDSELAEARKFARAGKVELMKACLSNAQEYAKRVGKEKEISAKVRKIGRTGYKKGIGFELERAKYFAGVGDAQVMEACLNTAQEYAKRVGKDIYAKVGKIREICYKKGIGFEEFSQECAKHIGKDIYAKVRKI